MLGRVMTTMAEMACWMGFGKGFELREYPVPEPESGTKLVDLRQHKTSAKCAERVKAATDCWDGEIVVELVRHPAWSTRRSEGRCWTRSARHSAGRETAASPAARSS